MWYTLHVTDITPLPDRSVDRFDDNDPTRSWTLAARSYTDPAWYERERETLFTTSWLYACHVSEVRDPGAFVTLDVVGQRVFVIRQGDGSLSGFFNVCQHRGHSLLEGRGVISNLITCPYHAWAYDTAGALQGARMSDRMEGFDHADFSLPGIAVEEFCGFVFVNLDAGATSMDDTYPGLRTAVLELEGNPESLELQSTSTFDIAANWKNVGDNLLECYHCHPAHRGFIDLIDMDHYLNETHEMWSIQSGPGRSENNTYDVTTGPNGFASIFAFPNVSFGRLPGMAGIFVFNFTPTGTETTRQDLIYFADQAEPTETEASAFEFFNEVLGPEDVALVEDVQVGLRSLGYHQGRFICIPDRPEISEHAVHHFHQMVRAVVAG